MTWEWYFTPDISKIVFNEAEGWDNGLKYKSNWSSFGTWTFGTMFSSTHAAYSAHS